MVAQLTTGKYREFAANNCQTFKTSYMNNSIEYSYFVININKIRYVNCENIQLRKNNTEINSTDSIKINRSGHNIRMY